MVHTMASEASLEARKAELMTKIGDASIKDDADAILKLSTELRKLNTEGKQAEEIAQRGARDKFLVNVEEALKSITLPKGFTLNVTGRRSDTGWDDFKVSVEMASAMETVHDALLLVLDAAPTTVNGFSFTSGKAEFTGRRSPTSTGNGGGGGGNHFWHREDGELLKLDTVYQSYATDDDRTAMAGAENGSKQWAIKVKVAKAAGYQNVEVEAAS
jgi:hypothetical protein